MEPSFKPPQTKEEFIKRADEMTVAQAQNMLDIMEAKRRQLVKPIDQEIEFYISVIEHKEGK